MSSFLPTPILPLLLYLLFSPTILFPARIVSLNPAMETLACCVYVAVAKQLPFMLRQWHNSLDRQTSAMVSRYGALLDCSV